MNTDNSNKDLSKNHSKIEEKKGTKINVEDEEISKNIKDMVTGLLDKDNDIQRNSYNLLKDLIISATGSITSIPKPLKYARVYYEQIKESYNKEDSQLRRKLLGDILTILVLVAKGSDGSKKEEKDKKTEDKEKINFNAETAVEETKKEEDIKSKENSLSYILENDLFSEFFEWGQELVRTVSGEITSEFLIRIEEERPYEDLLRLTTIVVKHLINNNNESEAIDLLIEMDLVDDIKDHCSDATYKRICKYLLAISNFSAEYAEQRKLLEIVYEIYSKFNDLVNALIIAVKMKENMYIKTTLANSSNNKAQQYQMAFILARNKVFQCVSDNIPDEINDIIKNTHISKYFKKLGNRLDVMKPKHPEDIFKSHLEEKKENINLESSKGNMSTSIVNGFINAGYGEENLIDTSKKNALDKLKDGNSNIDWLSKNKEEGLICALASLGLVNLWDIEGGPNEIEKYMENNESNPYKRGGYNLGLGILSSGVYDDNNVAMALLGDQVKDKNLTVKLTALLGLGLAFCGSQNEDIKPILSEALEDFSFGFDVSSFTSLCYGLIYLASGDEETIGTLFYILCERNEGGKKKLIESPFTTLYVLGIGLILLGKQKEADIIIETFQIEEFPAELRLFIKTILTICAYAGSGNVLKIQELQQQVGKKDTNSKVKQISIIGMSLIAIGEDIGCEMLQRSFNHILQFGNVNTKKAVPLALALLSVSNPQLSIMDILSKFVFDSDKEVAINAIFGLGLIASGTNNSKLSGNLRKIAASYAEDPDVLSIVRLSQGLLSLGKGALTLSPITSDRNILNENAISGLLITLLSMIEGEGLMCGKYQYLIYSLCLAIRPKMLMTLDKNLELKPVQVMVGQAIDTTGVTGNPKTISGFQVNNTPLLVNYGERCVLNGNDYKSYSNILEDIIIIEENEKDNRLENSKI